VFFERAEGFGQGFAAPDLSLHSKEELFEMEVLGPSADELEALEDRVSCPEKGDQFLVEHNEILVLNLLLKGEIGQMKAFPVLFDREDAKSLGFEVPPAIRRGGSEERLVKGLPLFSSQTANKIWHAKYVYL